MTRSDAARRDREIRFDAAPMAGVAPSADDTLQLYLLCARPDLTPSSAVALTLRAVGGLTTRQIAQAYLVPEATMAQRISRVKRIIGQTGVDRPGDVRTVMRVLYLVFDEGYSGDVDLAAEAIRRTRQLAALVDDAEVQGLLALMLLHHARRRRSRTRPDGRIVPLAVQDRRQWDTGLIIEGIEIAHAALGRDQLGEYQAQAALAPIGANVPQRDAVAAYLHGRNGELELAAHLYAVAARNAPNLAERDHQTRQAARLNERLRPRHWPVRRCRTPPRRRSAACSRTLTDRRRRRPKWRAQWAVVTVSTSQSS